MTKTSPRWRWAAQLAVVFASVASALALTYGPVAAQECYPPGSPACSTTTQAPIVLAGSLTISDDTPAAGQTVTLTANGFLPGTPVTFTIDGVVLGTVIADAQGVATLTVRLPADLQAGVHTIRATGTGADGRPRVVSRTITVPGAIVPVRSGVVGGVVGSTPPRGTLTRTGASVAATSAVGVGLVVGGLVLTRSVKKRKAVA